MEDLESKYYNQKLEEYLGEGIDYIAAKNNIVNAELDVDEMKQFASDAFFEGYKACLEASKSSKIKDAISITHELDKNDILSLRDTIFNATDKEVSDKEAIRFWNKLPDKIRKDALRWGVSDTPTRESIYLFIKNNPEL
jgi:hypothetical protein